MKSSQKIALALGLGGGLVFSAIIAGLAVVGFTRGAEIVSEIAEQSGGADGGQKVNAPAQWHKWAEGIRKKEAENPAKYDRLRAMYERVSPYVEVRRRLHRDSDFDFCEQELARQFALISDPLAALNYSSAIHETSAFTYDTEPEEVRAVVRRWTEERPESHFAWLIRGRQAINYAWYWRGTGWANTVTDEAWEHFHDAIDEARMCLEKAYAIEPGDPEISAEMLTICKAEGRPRREMEKHFERVVAIVPSHLRAYSAKFDFLRPAWAGSWPEYKEFYDSLDARIAEQGHPILRIAKRRALDTMESEWTGFPDGLTAEQRKQNERRDWFDIRAEMFETWPDDVIIRGQFAYQLMRAKKYREAREQFDWIGNRFPMDAGWSLEEYHRSRLNSYIYGSYRVPLAQRLHWLEEALDIDPDYYLTYHHIGAYHFRNEDFDAALNATYQALELDPTQGGPHILIATIREKEGNMDEAIQEIRTALALKLDRDTRELATKTLERLTGQASPEPSN